MTVLHGPITCKKSRGKHLLRRIAAGIATVWSDERNGSKYAVVCILQSLKPNPILASQSGIDSLAPLQSGRLCPGNCSIREQVRYSSAAAVLLDCDRGTAANSQWIFGLVCSSLPNATAAWVQYTCMSSQPLSSTLWRWTSHVHSTAIHLLALHYSRRRESREYSVHPRVSVCLFVRTTEPKRLKPQSPNLQ